MVLQSIKKYILFQVNNRIKSDLLELADVDGSCMSLHDTVMSLSDAIKGLNFIKQQWTGKSHFLRQDMYVMKTRHQEIVSSRSHF